MQEKKKEEKLGEALLKVAMGYQVTEVTEEYAEVDGELKLTKRKKTKRDVPPDLKAVQILLESGEEEYGGWSDEQLETERKRLLGLLQSEKDVGENPQKKGNEGSRVALKTKKPRAKPRKRVRKE